MKTINDLRTTLLLFNWIKDINYPGFSNITTELRESESWDARDKRNYVIFSLEKDNRGHTRNEVRINQSYKELIDYVIKAK